MADAGDAALQSFKTKSNTALALSQIVFISPDWFANKSLREIAEKIIAGEVVVHKLTIPEGWNAQEVRAALEAEPVLEGALTLPLIRQRVDDVLLVSEDDIELGIVADNVSRVRDINLDACQRTLPTFTGLRAQYTRGITSDHVAILDIVAILNDPRILVNDELDN